MMIFLWVYFSTLWSVLLIRLSVLLPTAHCLDYHSFIVSPSTLFFFNIVLAILGLLPLSINFRISLSISTKLAGVLIGIVLNLQIKLGSTDILATLSLPLHEGEISLHSSFDYVHQIFI